MKVVIIGGVAGGATAAARLRRLDEKAEIIIVERGEYVSFANCGLPYYIGETIKEQEKLTLQTPEKFKSRFNIEVRINSEATAVNPSEKTVQVHNLKTGEVYALPYDKLLLSPGAQPIVPKGLSLDTDGVFTLRNIPDTVAIKQFINSAHPKRAVIVGGGFIGVEMADNLKGLGIDVTVIDASSHILGNLDEDTASEVQVYMQDSGVKLMMNTRLSSINKGNGDFVVGTDGGDIEADLVILAIGVRPDTAFLNNSGVTTNGRGAIVVNEHLQTNIPDVYAVGDAVAVTDKATGEQVSVNLAGPANKQGRIVADNIVGIPSVYGGANGASILKVFEMTVASVGVNEKTAGEKNIDYDKTYIYAPSHAGYYPGGRNMLIKALWEKNSGRLLGMQAVGFDGVDKRIDVFSTALSFGATVDDLTKLNLSYAPPFNSAKDPLNMLGYVGENVRTDKLRQFFWHDVCAVATDETALLLDVRTTAERQRGFIEPSAHIPLDSLRQQMGELDKSKRIYIYCHSGLRSYIAYRILAGNGFDCVSLAGGYRFYETVINQKQIGEYHCAK